MQLSLSGSFLTPTFNLKPVLFVVLSTISSASLYSSLSSDSSEGKQKIKEILSKVSGPLNIATEYIGGGVSKLFTSLSNWAKIVVNQKDKVSEWVSGNPTVQKVASGAKIIFSNLKQWSETAVKFAKDILPSFLKEWKQIKEILSKYVPIVWNSLSVISDFFKANTGGDTPLIAKLFEAVGHEKFGDFTSAIGDIAKNNGKVLSDLSGQEAGDILSAFKSEPDKTVEVMKEFGKEGVIKGKDDLMSSLKTYSLIGKIKEVKKRATELIGKGAGMSPEEKKEAKEVFDNLQKLQRELQSTIASAKKQLGLSK
ncbi:hypothetical protein A6V39_01000 [Candidatus Mycoplasma haematobovis]|uniref:Uncharacterized protein n=1 Tax=Candidatus Mycoplasma haematobovis TaxID=432608 RepID=A0A1A9QFZ9_9MOLU|nr:hypothetical protein [Candidatus Mycoplasma haematobovis]OAL10630.1 hypothetical protein A6V39_01000 [Candidatus Mycoplasma haematobovis]